MPAASDNIWRILYTVSRYLFPFLSVLIVFLVFFYILSENRAHREKAAGLPGFGTVGELVVLSGGRDLDTNTWFPVPREGVLGAVRSCDLVIPCPGVHAKHLDFSWEDGTGLLIYLRTGCEASVNGVPVTCRTKASDFPLTHGSVLQVGSAVLRLHLFAALDNTGNRVFAGPADPAAQPPAVTDSGSFSAAGSSVAEFPEDISQRMRQQTPDAFFPESAEYAPQPSTPASARFSPEPAEYTLQAVQETPPVSSVEELRARYRRSDRWKEDLGE